MKTVRFLFLLVAVILTVAPRAGAVMMSLTTADMVKASGVVVRGTVKDTSGHLATDGRLIFTRARLMVNEVVRGSLPGNEIFVEYEGGEANGNVLAVSDMPHLATGEEVILFLIPSQSFKYGDTVYRIYGFAQGTYAITGGTARSQGYTVLPGGKGSTAHGASRTLPLDDLIKEIKAVP